MQIVIDISEEDYKDIIENGLCGYSSVRENVSNAIKASTPLPKNHGDLIDRDELLNCSYEIDGAYTYEEVVHIDDVRQAPTIIEAEKEKEKMTITKINDNYMDTQGNIYVDAYTSEGKNVEVLIYPAGTILGHEIELSDVDKNIYVIKGGN